MKRRPLVQVALAAGAVLGTTLVATPALAAPPDPVPVDCPTFLPTAEAVDGLNGVGYSVSQGTQPEKFTAKILGRITNGIANHVDMIMAELDSPALTRAGGVWSGMSGSPVYALDGRLIGSVSYTMAASTAIAGITPAASMDKLLSADPDDRQARAADMIEPDAPAVDRLVRAGGMSRRKAASGFTALKLPLSIAGLAEPPSAARLKEFQRQFGRPVVAAGAAADRGADAGDIVGGSNFAAVMSYGSLTAGGIGTTTYTCRGKAVAFGHPFTDEGMTTLSAHAASAVMIQPETEGNGPHKVANIGAIKGVVDRDRTVGIRAQLGAHPRGVPVTSHLTRVETGEKRSESTVVVDPPRLVYFSALQAGEAVARAISASLSYGSARLSLVITGKRANGATFTLRSNEVFVVRKYSDLSLPFQVTRWALRNVGALSNDQDFEDVTIGKIQLSGTVSSEVKQWTGPTVSYSQHGRYAAYPKGLTVKAGRSLHFKASFSQWREPSVRTTVSAALKVPRSARGHDLQVIVSADSDKNKEPYDIAEFMANLDSYSQILAKLRATPRSDQVTAQLVDQQTGKVYTTRRIRLSHPIISFERSTPLRAS